MQNLESNAIVLRKVANTLRDLVLEQYPWPLINPVSQIGGSCRLVRCNILTFQLGSRFDLRVLIIQLKLSHRGFAMVTQSSSILKKHLTLMGW